MCLTWSTMLSMLRMRRCLVVWLSLIPPLCLTRVMIWAMWLTKTGRCLLRWQQFHHIAECNLLQIEWVKLSEQVLYVLLRQSYLHLSDQHDKLVLIYHTVTVTINLLEKSEEASQEGFMFLKLVDQQDSCQLWEVQAHQVRCFRWLILCWSQNSAMSMTWPISFILLNHLIHNVLLEGQSIMETLLDFFLVFSQD